MFVSKVMKLVAAVFLILFFQTSYSQFDSTALSTKLNQVKDKLGKDVAFILYKNGKIVYKKEMGSFTIKTPQPIGASSQWLTTALVMTFVQEGKLSLDDKVATYIPVFTKHFKGYITIRQCLTNFTGIQSEQGVLKLLQKNKFKTLEEAVNNFAEKRDIQTNPGTEFRYSNVGFEIAGRVLEIIAKKPFDRLMSDRILRPLAMKNTTFTNDDYNEAVNPAFGAHSSAADFTNFMAMLLNKGTLNNKQILTESSVETLHTLTTNASEIKYAPKLVEGLNYTLGEWVLEMNSQGKSASVAVPSLQGTWPMIDLCRGYTCIIFTKDLMIENRNLYMDIKATIDNVIGGNCQ